MKQRIFSRLLRRVSALMLAASLCIPPVFASAGTTRIQTEQTLTDGLTYFNTVSEHSTGRVESFSLELSPTSTAFPILLQASGTVYGAATIHKAVTLAQEQGYQVLAALNTDYFSTATGVPRGIVIEDGIYKSCADGNPAMLVSGSTVSLNKNPAVSLTLTNQRTQRVTTPNYFNKWRTKTGGTYLLNRDFSTVSTRTSTSGWFVRMQIAGTSTQNSTVYDPSLDQSYFPSQASSSMNFGGGWNDPTSYLPPSIDSNDYTNIHTDLTVNSTLVLEVTEVLQSDGALVIGENEYILTADDYCGLTELYESFQVGDRITLKTSCQDPALAQAQWAGGVGDIMIENGAMTNPEHWLHHDGLRAPRSAIGMKADGTLLFYAVDGRKSSHSVGLTQPDLANEMLQQGCVWAANLDGGGSTAISVWVPGQVAPDLQNLPSDGRARNCATYVLLVTRQSSDNIPARLAMKEAGLTVLTGSSVPLPETVVLDSGLQVLDLPLEELTIVPSAGLGFIEDGIYTAGTTPGTEILELYTPEYDISGFVPLHVVDTLTSLSVTRADTEKEVTQLSLNPLDTVTLSAAGSYWGRAAMRQPDMVVWNVDSDAIGHIDESGVFTAGPTAASGTILVSAGSTQVSIPVTINSLHEDVPANHWAHPAVSYCYQNGIVDGLPFQTPNQFGRDQQIIRGDFMLMLYNAMGKPEITVPATFTDVLPTDHYYNAISWAQQAGLASGMGDGIYGPQSLLTREQSFTILRQALPLFGKYCPDTDLSSLEQFPDYGDIAEYAKPHAAAMVAQGLISGKGDGLDPKGNLTRAETAALLYRILITSMEELPGDTEDPDLEVSPEVSQPQDTEEPTDDLELPESFEYQDNDEPELPSVPVPDPALHTLTLNQTAGELNSGESLCLTAQLEPALEGAVITWRSSSPTTATVSQTGVVTNLFPGVGTPSVTITASCGDITTTCTVVCHPAKRTGTVINAELGLNVRSGPGSQHPIIGYLSNRFQVVILSEQEGWYQILYPNDANEASLGYVHSDYLTVEA